MKLSNYKVKQELTVIIFIACVVTLIIATACVYIAGYGTKKSEIKKELEVLAHIASNNSTGALAFNNYNNAVEVLDSLKSNPNLFIACLYTFSGEVFAFYSKDLANTCPTTVLKGTSVSVKRDDIHIFKDVVENTNILGHLYLGYRPELINDYIVKQLGIMVLTQLITLALVVYPLARRLQNIISTPIEKLVAEKLPTNIGWSNKSNNEIKALDNFLIYIQNYLDKLGREVSINSHRANSMQKTVKTSIDYLEHKSLNLFKSTALMHEYVLHDIPPDVRSDTEVILRSNLNMIKNHNTTVKGLKELHQKPWNSNKEWVKVQKIISDCYKESLIRKTPNVSLKIIDQGKELEVFIEVAGLHALIKCMFSIFSLYVRESDDYDILAEPIESGFLLALKVKTSKTDQMFSEVDNGILFDEMFKAKYISNLILINEDDFSIRIWPDKIEFITVVRSA